jgi:DNA-directed RNA polymerase specialized sigma24 family protein
MVLRAGRSDTKGAGEALAHLCQVYWFPLYAQVRRRGHSAHDAQDLTQGFFARLLANDTIAHADPARGRFRSFVLTALKHFLNDEWEKSRAVKRGGGVQPVPIDLAAAERQFHAEPADAFAPDKAFDCQWAVVLLEVVLTRLEEEYRAAGKAKQFAVLKLALTGASDAQPYAKLAAELGATEGAVKVAVHRLRRRYRELLEAEIAHTVASPEEAAAELQYLFRALAE